MLVAFYVHYSLSSWRMEELVPHGPFYNILLAMICTTEGEQKSV